MYGVECATEFVISLSCARVLIVQRSPTAVPSNFGDRVESDRYDTTASPTLITNATIWTGNKSGREVMSGGEIFIDKGIIKYVGDRAPVRLVNSDR